MIVVDIETSGLDFNKCGIWQIGALDFYNPENTFLEECGIDEGDVIQDKALDVSEIKEEELRDSNKQSQKQLLENFFKWVEGVKIKNFICENPQFDLGFIATKARKYGLAINFHHRAFDLHSIACLKHFQIRGEFLIKEDHSDMGLPNSLKFCGISDERKIVEGGEIIKEGKPHNALEDCKLTAECFSRLIYGKGLFEEYAKFPIQKYLKK